MYRKLITDILEIAGLTGVYSVRAIEAFMRDEHGTLDNLSRPQFIAEVRMACSMIEEFGERYAETLADSYGIPDAAEVVRAS